MKRIFTFIAAGFICSLGYGQTQQKIHKSDGSKLELPLLGIDSINFSISQPPSMHIHRGGNITESVLLKDIDSVTYTGTDWGQPMLIPLAGQISDENGQPVPGAVIRVGSLTEISDTNGVFYFPAALVLERLGYVTASKTSFFPGSRTFLPKQGTNKVEIRLLRKNMAGTIQAASGGTVQAEGVNITFPANGFVKNGAAYNGNVQVSVNYIDPESSRFDSEMPGNLLGMIGGISRGLISYGMVAVEISDNNGDKVELASGKTAEIRFPLSDSLQSDAPDEIDLWYFDEESGLWQQEGTATRQGNEYLAHVSHFSFWNCDIPFPYVELKGTITDTEGNAVSGAKVSLFSPTQGGATDYTSSSGDFGGFVPANEVLTMKVSIPCDTTGVYEEVFSQEVGPFSQSTSLPPTSATLSNLTSISGTIKGCQNSSVNSGYIVASGSAYFADSSGGFSFLSCSNETQTLKAFTSQPWAAGISKDVSVTGSKVNAGEFLVCSQPGGNVSDIDGNQYATVTIGTQEWMAENLKTTKFADGSAIPNVAGSSAWTQLYTPAWCNYENNAGYNATYGKLYNWYAVADPRNVCPAGWHVPTDAEWTVLTDYLGGQGVAGGKMKSVSGWLLPNTAATNESGFSGLPGSIRSGINGVFNGTVGSYGYWWSSSETGTVYAWFRRLDYDSGGAYRIYGSMRNGSSVRCLRD